MDDLELRKRLLSDPNTDDKMVLEGLNANEANQKLAKELKELDLKIASAMKVEVPENLASQLILRQSIQSHQQNKRKSKIQLAVAASIALVVSLGVNFFYLTPHHTHVAEYATAHYFHESEHFSKTATSNISLASVNDSLSDFKVKFTQKIGQLISIDDCFYDGMDSIHLVFEGQYDNITMFIIPKNKHLKYTREFSDKTIRGITTQFKQADVIILGDKREQLDRWQDKVSQNMQFSI